MDHELKFQIPSTKSQIKEKTKTKTTKYRRDLQFRVIKFWSLKIGIYLVLGAWDLGFFGLGGEACRLNKGGPSASTSGGPRPLWLGWMAGGR
jgi:hypothetical protein